MTTRSIYPQPKPTSRLLYLGLILSGLSGAIGVMSLALSEHSEFMGLLRTAAHMLLFHAPVFLAIGILAQVRRVPVLPVALILMTAGVFLFSGDLMARVFWDQRLFPMSAPTGGMLTIIGWLILAFSAVRVRPKE
ncbi:MAG: DUF423 domain-containing protein [Roseibium sp.]